METTHFVNTGDVNRSLVASCPHLPVVDSHGRTGAIAELDKYQFAKVWGIDDIVNHI